MNEPALATDLATPGAATPEKATPRPRKKTLKNLLQFEGRGEIWYFKKVVNGKREFNGRKTPFSLETTDLRVAIAKRDAILKAASGAEIDRVLNRTVRQIASLGDVKKAYDTAPTVRANGDTRKRNYKDLERMIRAVKGAEFDVAAAGVDILTKQLVKQWQRDRLAAAATEHAGDAAALEAAKRALNSTLTHAQSIFSQEAMDDYSALYLPPNIQEFATALPVPARKQEDPRQLSDEFVGELLEQVKVLGETDVAAWVAFQLMTWGGFRNIETLHMKRSWLEQVPAGYRIEVRPEGDFTPKGNTRAVILPAVLIEEILERIPAASEYLVPGAHYSDRHDAVYRRLNTWLKVKGVAEDAGKIAYRLRKFWAKKVEEQQGLFIAQAGLGHSSVHTTQGHYTGKNKMAAPVELKLVS